MAKGKAIIVHPRFKHTLPVLQSHGSFDALPAEVLAQIARACDSPAALCTLSMLNKQCWSICNEDAAWKLQLERKFGFCPSHEVSSWKDFYRFQHEFFMTLVLKGGADWTSNRMRFRGGMPHVPIQHLVI